MQRQTYFKSSHVLISIVAILLSAANMFIAPLVMPSVEQQMRVHQILPQIIDASPPYMSQDEHGNIEEHPLDTYYRVRLFFKFQFPSVVISVASGVVIGTLVLARWARFAFLFSIMYCLAPFLFSPWRLLVLFGGFDAATPLDVWLQELQSLAIVTSSTIAGALIGSKFGNRRARLISHKTRSV